MSRDKRHTRTLPNGEFVVTTLACDDSDTDKELSLCSKVSFELGREWLVTPVSSEGMRFVNDNGPEWRLLVHHSDWSAWGEPSPLGSCVCVTASSLGE